MESALTRSGWRARQDRGDARPKDVWVDSADGSLVAAALGGRSDAYGELVRRNQLAVYNVAYRLVGERQAALDVAQDAFVRAFQSLRTFKGEYPFGPWIKRITTNVALDWLERRPRTVPLPQWHDESPADTGEDAIAGDLAQPEPTYLRNEEHARVQRAILSLPPRNRAVIDLRYFQDLSYDDIAAVLDIPLSDVKSDLFRTRRRLRDRLEQD